MPVFPSGALDQALASRASYEMERGRLLQREALARCQGKGLSGLQLPQALGFGGPAPEYEIIKTFKDELQEEIDEWLEDVKF